jgi:hypothetical protein
MCNPTPWGWGFVARGDPEVPDGGDNDPEKFSEDLNAMFASSQDRCLEAGIPCDPHTSTYTNTLAHNYDCTHTHTHTHTSPHKHLHTTHIQYESPTQVATLRLAVVHLPTKQCIPSAKTCKAAVLLCTCWDT